MTESHALPAANASPTDGAGSPPVDQDDRPCLLEAGDIPSVGRVVLRHEEAPVGPALFRWHRDGKLIRATIEPVNRSDQVLVDGEMLAGRMDITEGMTVSLAGRPYRFFVNGDIHHLLRDEVYALAARDDVTGCLSRETLMDRLAEVYADAREDITPLCLVAFDLAEHASIRETMVPEERDNLYRELVETVGQRLRQRDLLFRAQEHLFMLVLPHTRSDVLEGLCSRIQEQSQAFKPKATGAPPLVTVRVRVTTGPLPRADQNHTDLLAEAEASFDAAEPEGEVVEG